LGSHHDACNQDLADFHALEPVLQADPKRPASHKWLKLDPEAIDNFRNAVNVKSGRSEAAGGLTGGPVEVGGFA
jgi:hypothetical protein